MSKDYSELVCAALQQFDVEAARRAAEQAVAAGADARAIIEAATQELRALGDRFHNFEIFLPHLILAGDAMQAVLAVLEPTLPQDQRAKKPKIVLGTVEGDLHDIGKNIVMSMLNVEGFEVHDLGKDVSVERFISKAEEVGADIIATSSLMTVTMPTQRQLEEALKRRGLRGKYQTMVGGGPTTREWAETIGADGWGKDAAEAVATAKRLTSSR